MLRLPLAQLFLSALLLLPCVSCDQGSAPVPAVDAGANLCEMLDKACRTCSSLDCLVTAEGECASAKFVPAASFCASCHAGAGQ
ncbi:MAG: hypothetical protein HY698_07755 [Deltaproteobacteria bacterium]|nr:hypothetical protein [Deltaproteobacteria bacterium]